MSRYTWLFDAGHGGIIDGVYQTPTKKWKKSYFKDEKLMDANLGEEYLEDNCDMKHYEGVSNRDIVNKIKKLCDIHNIDYVDVVDSETDVSLSTRVALANKEQVKKGNCIYVSIHSDAFTTGSAQGFSVYTTPGFTNSDKVATFFFKEIALEFPDHKPRPDYTDGDPDKEENFYVIKKTSMPAILTETMFYTNYEEAKLLGSEEGIQRIANAHFKAIMAIEKNGY